MTEPDFSWFVSARAEACYDGYCPCGPTPAIPGPNPNGRQYIVIEAAGEETS